MFDLHTHSLLSDGELLPEELIRHSEALGYRLLVIADHAGFCNMAETIAALKRTCTAYRGVCAVRVLAGVEITHVHPALIARAVEEARGLGAELVVGHGETLAEPVAAGTNRAFIEAGVDVLAHPGLISEQDARRAAEKGVLLEISGRKVHSLSNGYVAALARRCGARLSFGSDTHSPSDLRGRADAELVLRGAGLTAEEVEQVFADMGRFSDR